MGTLNRIADWIVKFVLANVLWILFVVMGLGIFGFVPATVSLFTITRKWLMGDTDIPIFRTFWRTYWHEFLKSNLLGWILAIIGYVLYVDVKFFYTASGLFGHLIYYLVLSFSLAFIITIAYFFPVYVHFQLKTFRYIRNAFLFAVFQPLSLLFMLGTLVAMYLLVKFLPSLFPFYGVSLLSFMIMGIAYRSFNKLSHKYQPKSDDEN